jgi:putative phosphoesterase
MMNSHIFLLLSDTHGNLPALEAALRWAKGRSIDTALFLGDGADDLFQAQTAAGFAGQWKKIRGNCDENAALPEVAVFEFCGKRFFLAHGHRFALYNGYDTLAAAAAKAGASAALFGHTHIPFYSSEGGLLLINPGSIGKPRSSIGASFAVIECAPEGEKLPKAHFFGIGASGKIRELKVKST